MKLTLPQARKLVVEIVGSFPVDKVNPTSGDGICIYDDFKGNHCIVGEVLHRLGLKIPRNADATMPFNALKDDYVESGVMTKPAAEWLAKIQRIFDNDGNVFGSSPTWPVALELCRERGLL